MAEQNTQTTVSETQLIQMARQEDSILTKKREMLERLSGFLAELITAKDTLKEIRTNKGKVFIGIGATIMVEAQVTDTENCKRGFSENGFKDEKISETIEWLENKENSLKKQIEALSKEYSESEGRMVQINGILKQIQGEKRKMVENSKRAPPTISK
ncbi:Prefoldin subunit alpha [uncultured archaeon]|nr:Prefoldin subunit alpha [uncultured archaeon]